MVRVADTGVLYALFDEEDRHHAQARADVAEPEPILVPSEILVETAGLVRIRLGREAERTALRDLLGLPNLSMAPKVQVVAVRAVYESAGGKLSLADAFVVQTCRATGARPLAYDDDIRRAAR